jgi:hypothetical protein
MHHSGFQMGGILLQNINLFNRQKQIIKALLTDTTKLILELSVL